jgi:membrane protein YqaA with SNARE-associated domain
LLVATTANSVGSAVDFVVGGLKPGAVAREAAAQLLADDAMTIRPW